MKALLLAAGLGSRLRPLTLHLPKPLCLFYGQALLDIVYRQINGAGIHALAINTHHLADKITAHIASRPTVYKHAPQLSYEPEILGTGGCINPLRDWIGGDHLLIYNADIIADVDLKALIKQHKAGQADATMVLLPQLKAGTTPIYWDGQGRVHQIGGHREASLQATFSGIHILGPRLIDRIPRQGFQHVIDSYQKLLAGEGRIEAFVHRGFWADLGTPLDYFEAHRALLQSADREAVARRLGLSSETSSKPSISWHDSRQSATVDQAVVGTIQDSFLFGPIQMSPTQSIHNCIVYPSSRIIGQTTVERQIITPEVYLGF